MFLAFLHIAKRFENHESRENDILRNAKVIIGLLPVLCLHVATMTLLGNIIVFTTVFAVGKAAPHIDVLATPTMLETSLLNAGLGMTCAYLAIQTPAAIVVGTLRRAEMLDISLRQTALQTMVISIECAAISAAAISAGVIALHHTEPAGHTSMLLSMTIAALLIDITASAWATGWWLEEKKDGDGLIRKNG